MQGFFLFWEHQGVGGFFLIFAFYFVLEFPRLVFLDYVLLVIYYLRKKFNSEARAEARNNLWKEQPLVSIIVPGKDEGENYYKLVNSLQEQTYQNFEIIVVDDGSEDQTRYIGRDLERNGKIDLFLRNEVRGGKASAANLALKHAKGKFVLHLDADCSFFYDAVEESLIPFYQDSQVGAVSCAIEVRNSDASLATRFQTIEYLLSINVGRMVNSSMGILRLVSGAFGAFRRKALLEVGGWDVGPGLDGDVAQKIMKKPRWKISFTSMAVALTDVPETFKALAKQRSRWSRSMVRFRMRKHRDVFYPEQNFHWSTMMASWDNIFFNLILNVSWWVYILFIVASYVHYVHYIFISIFLLYSASKFAEFAVVILVSHHKYDKIKLLWYLPGMVFYTSYYMRVIRTYGYISEFFQKASFKDKWNPRKSSVAAKKMEDSISSIFG